MNIRHTLSIFLTLSAVISAALSDGPVADETAADPVSNIIPMKVYMKGELPKSMGTQGDIFWIEDVLVNRMDVTADTGVPRERLPGDRITLVLKGAVRMLVDGKAFTLKERECIYLQGSTSYSLSSADITADIVEIYWPAGGIDHSHNDMPFPVGGVTYGEMYKLYALTSMMRPWEGQSVGTSEPSQYAAPSLPHNRPVHLDALQYSRLAGQPWMHVIQGKRGQLLNMVMSSSETTSPSISGEDRIFMTLRGSLELTVADSMLVLNENNVLWLPKNTTYSGTAGEDGCELLVIMSSSDEEIAQAAKERIARFASIIEPGTTPVLLYDGIMSEPGLSFSEGPSWLNGNLYVTNTTIFGARPGWREQGTLNVLDDDGTLAVLEADLQPVGTFPLPNGNIAATEMIGHSVVELTPEGTVVRTIADTYEGQSFGGPNDLVVDDKGGIYFTDPWGGRLGEVPGTAVYYVRPSGEVVRLTEWNEYRFPNGCILSPDGSKFYLCSAPGRTEAKPSLWLYDVAGDGTIANKRKFADILFGRTADGITIDRTGNLYVATGTGGVQMFDPSGDYIGHIHFPEQAQNCVFGGDDLSTLYVTCRSRIYLIGTTMKGIRLSVR